MVNNVNQYFLVHLVLVEYLAVEDTCLPCDANLSKRLAEAKKNSQTQYQRYAVLQFHK